MSNDTIEEIDIEEEEDEENVSGGYETLKLIAEQDAHGPQLDAILESKIEADLMEAEAKFSNNMYTDDDITFAMYTIVLLKNNILRKYNPEKQKQKGGSEEVIVVKRIADHLLDDPLRYIRALNNYIFPILRTKYLFGLKYEKLDPWQKNKKIKVSELVQKK